MLCNEKYAGYNNRGKHDTGVIFVNKNAYAKVKDRGKYSLQKNDNIPSIVEEEMFWKCQELLDSKAENQKGIYKGVTKYVGLLYCKQCGKTYISNKDVDRHFYNCSTKKRYGVGTCNNPNITLKRIEDFILELCNGKYKEIYDKRVQTNSKAILDVKNQLLKKLNTNVIDNINEKKLEKEKCKKAIEKLLDLYTEDEIDKETYQSKKIVLNNRIQEIQKEIDSLGNKDTIIIEDINQIDIILSQNNEVKEKYSEDELLSIINKIQIQEDGSMFVLDEYTIKTTNLILKYFNKNKDMDYVF